MYLSSTEDVFALPNPWEGNFQNVSLSFLTKLEGFRDFALRIEKGL